MNVRYVTIKGVRYLRADDVATYINELAGAEETDVRDRLTEASVNMLGGAREEKRS